jgi:hypothetical protein
VAEIIGSLRFKILKIILCLNYNGEVDERIKL